MLPVNWRGDGQEFVLLSGNAKEGGMIDGHLRRGNPVMFPEDGHPELAANVLDVIGDQHRARSCYGTRSGSGFIHRIVRSKGDQNLCSDKESGLQRVELSDERIVAELGSGSREEVSGPGGAGNSAPQLAQPTGLSFRAERLTRIDPHGTNATGTAASNTTPRIVKAGAREGGRPWVSLRRTTSRYSESTPRRVPGRRAPRPQRW